jgi:hypothetical protein
VLRCATGGHKTLLAPGFDVLHCDVFPHFLSQWSNLPNLSSTANHHYASLSFLMKTGGLHDG